MSSILDFRSSENVDMNLECREAALLRQLWHSAPKFGRGNVADL